MFELRSGGEERRWELVEEARAASGRGQVWLQVFARHDRRRSPEDEREGEFEAARLVDLLEPEGWTLENAAAAGELENDWAYGVRTATAVGTIYTFRAANHERRRVRLI